MTESHTEITPTFPENVSDTTTEKEVKDIEVITEVSEEVLATTPQYVTVQLNDTTEPTDPTPILTTDQVTETPINPEEQTHESHDDNEIITNEVYDQSEKDYNDEYKDEYDEEYDEEYYDSYDDYSSTTTTTTITTATTTTTITTTTTTTTTTTMTTTLEEEYDEYDDDYYDEDYDENEESEESSETNNESEADLIYRNYEILSDFYKKHFVDLRVLDTSCEPTMVPPPKIEHGYVKEYLTSENVLLPGQSYHEIIYAW